MHFHFILFQP